jgi:hypothetical protein
MGEATGQRPLHHAYNLPFLFRQACEGRGGNRDQKQQRRNENKLPRKGERKMRATTTLGNLIEQVETMSAGNFDETVSLNEMEFASLNEMWIGGVGVEVLPQAQRLLSNRLRVPFTYLERCPAELQAENLNHWLKEERKQRETFFLRFDGQKYVRAVFTDRYTAIDNREILSKMLDAVDPIVWTA